MNIMDENRKLVRGKLAETVAYLTKRLAFAQAVLQDFDDQPESHVFDEYENACTSVEDYLMQKAAEACEGSHCYGNDYYEQEFIVNGVHYMGKLDVDYNRHDKTYYYVDRTEFEVNEIINKVKETL